MLCKSIKVGLPKAKYKSQAVYISRTSRQGVFLGPLERQLILGFDTPVAGF
jgi:hypothetical protein